MPPRRNAAASKPPAPTTEADWRALLGRKVSVRYHLHGEPAHPFSEAIGMVQSVADGTVEIITRRGDVRSVPVDDVIAAKVFG
ncbi:MAG: hypothetical protein ACRDJI_00700 [Actinomycetota bacterium]